MFGPYALTHFVYVVLVVAFVAVMSYMFYYNIREKRKEEALRRNGFRPNSKGEAIIISRNAMTNADKK